VERITPGYLVREEKLRSRVGRKMWKFKERLIGGGSSEITMWCLEEVRGRMMREKELGDRRKKKVSFGEIRR